VVLVSILGIFASSKLKGLRVLRALRPLRAISRFPSLQLVVFAMVSAVPQILNVLVLCALFFMMFGIAFVNFFKGALSSCTGPVFDAFSAVQVWWVLPMRMT
jgi:hypothetical protein